MSTYPHMVNVAWDTVTAFLCDWQREPYRWSKEIDVQVAITSRLSQALRAMGRDTVVANYRSAIEGFHGNQRWSRVCCEPLVRYRFSDGKDYKCYPDIVMLGDAKNPDRPPEEDRGNFPILWACEIKYQGEDDQRGTKTSCDFLSSKAQSDSGVGSAWILPALQLAMESNGSATLRTGMSGSATRSCLPVASTSAQYLSLPNSRFQLQE